MKREIDIYDDIEDKIPQKKQINPKTKRLLVYLLCIIIGLAVAFGAIWLYETVFSGASTPQQAVAEYERAALLYDIDGMIEYSSDYNKTVLYGNQETSDKLLRAYLNKAYSDKTPAYTDSQISFKLVSSIEYEKGSKKYDEALDKYTQKVKDGSNIDKIAIVRMTVVKGTNETTRNYLSVKIGGRWFFAYAAS